MTREAFRPGARMHGLALVVVIVAAAVSGAGIGVASTSHKARPHRSHARVAVRAPAGGTLLSVACPAKRLCRAVGDDETIFGPRKQLGQWTGANWHFQATRGGRFASRDLLNAISCPTARTCVAVGAHYLRGGTVSVPLAQVLKRSRWLVIPVPAPPAHRGTGSRLTGLSCLSASNCIAVGFNQTRSGTVTLAERWNGVKWRIQPTPNVRHARSSFFTRVSCTNARACTAIGTFVTRSGTQLAFAQRWNGARWLMQATAPIKSRTGSVLTGVSCPAVRFCVAVGGFVDRNRTLAEVWHGTIWSTQPIPSPAHAVSSSLGDVSCRTTKYCRAVGFFRPGYLTGSTLVERWNGTRWAIVSSPGRGTVSDLFSVSCPASSECIAVGDYTTRQGSRRPLVETWFGARWRIAP